MIFHQLWGWQSRLAQAVLIPVRTATKRASGGKAANKNTAGRRLGPKKGEGEYVQPGQIIWRQRGTVWYPGENVGIGRDHTLYASEPGYVRFYRDPFHARRRFIGVALGKDERLPTPHFAPRRRRFGYTPIDNAEVAQFELEYLTRKETEQALARDKIQESRVASRERRIERYSDFIVSHVATLGEDSLRAQAERLDSIYQYLCGCGSVEEARKIVDGHIREDLKTDLRVGRLSKEQYEARMQDYSSSSEAVDSKVTFGPNRQLTTAFESPEAEQQSREAAIAEIKQLTEPYLESQDGTPKPVVAQVLDILSRPVFSQSHAVHLKRKYLRRPLPILLSSASNRAELEKRANKGDGEIRDVWNYERRKVCKYFVPQGGKLLF